MIRPLSISDIPDIYDIADGWYPRELTETKESIISKINIYPQGCLGIEVNNRLVGYLLSYPHSGNSPKLSNIIKDPLGNEYYWIHDMCILRDHTFNGWGTKLFHTIKKNCLELKINKIKLISVGSSPSYWKHLGFKEKEFYPEYHGNLMERTI